MNFNHAHKRARDADEQAASLPDWDQRYEQITAGRFDGEVDELWVGPVQVFSELANQTVVQTGRAGGDRVSVALLQGAHAPGWYNGHRLQCEQLIGLPPFAEFDLVAGAGMHILGLSVDTPTLRDLLTQSEGPNVTLPTVSTVLEPSPSALQTFKQLIGTALGLARCTNSAPCMHEASRRMLALSLSHALLDCLRTDPPHGSAAVLPASASSRRRIVCKARQYMQAHAQEVIAVPELCQAIGTSRRALQYAFEDVMQISPVTYLRAMRLNQVRRALRQHPDTLISDVASRWGFWHLSRFATDYRTLFGELPSATRAASAHR